MIQVLVIANNFLQASYRLRVEALRAGLVERGIQLDVRLRPRGVLARRRLLRSAGRFDAVLLQRKLMGSSDMALLRRHARRIYFDIDDAVMFHNRDVGLIDRWRTWRRFIATAKNVHCVMAGNAYLAERFAEQGTMVRVLPTVVDPARYQIKIHAPTSSPALAWIGSASTLPYVRQLSSTLAATARATPGLRLIVIADRSLDLPMTVCHIPWSIDAESESLCEGDIGIAPTPTDRWTLGKCGFKIIQYMAAGLPVVASPVGANAEIVVPGETGFLADTPREWFDAIRTLASDPALRSAMGQAGRRRVEQHYALGNAIDAWAELLTSGARDQRAIQRAT